jgi:uncharacterized protein (DUF2249 family)
MTAHTAELDVRGLEPPEPLVLVMTALETLPAGGSLLLKIDCRPFPLYRLLDRNGYGYEERPGRETLLEITIRARPGTGSPAAAIQDDGSRAGRPGGEAAAPPVAPGPMPPNRE